MGTNSSISTRITNHHLFRYVQAFLAALTASLICSGLEHFAGKGGTYVMLLLAVVFSAWYCGVGPSIVATILGLVGTMFGFLPRFHSFRSPDPNEAVGTLAFLLSSIIVVMLGESRRRQNEALQQAQGELELKVQERTSDLEIVNRNLRELSARLMQLQDDERRRIARELHDSVGQTLAALAMNLGLVRSDVERLTKIADALNDSENLVREMSSEVRTISHLLHPPLLDEAGLSSALRWYVNGFAQRSGIKVDLDLPDDFSRLSSEMETAIFRVVQESLTNIHRHSGSPAAKIVLRQHKGEVLVKVEDNGKGIPPEKLEEMASAGTPGVGIRGMRERLRQLGGRVEIESGESGTVVIVQLPIPEGSATEVVSLAGPAAA